MTEINEKSVSTQLAELAVKGMQERKGQEICVMDLREVGNSICDYFVICHGSSNTNVEAIAESVEDEVRNELGEKPWHREGLNNSEWVLLDYFNVVVHVFQKDIRDYYNLEDLWADAKLEYISDENE